MRPSSFRIIGLALLVTIAACGSKEKPRNDAPSRTGQTPGTTPATDADTTSESIKIKTSDDKRVVEFKMGNSVKIEIGAEGSAKTMRGELRETGKRKYEMEGGAAVAEVKPDDDAFKVRTPDGKLLWKVKLADDKIKISDNEENQNPYELKFKEEKIKVEENQKPLGEVKFYADRGKVKVSDASDKDLFESNTTRRSAAYGVLLMSRIPENERYIIMAELLARGK
jgi:hypothetical protein